jgi:hypothetical protein
MQLLLKLAIHVAAAGASRPHLLGQSRTREITKPVYAILHLRLHGVAGFQFLRPATPSSVSILPIVYIQYWCSPTMQNFKLAVIYFRIDWSS